jgi:DUF4097 and DUF4098 domain-containing protein YvlB
MERRALLAGAATSAVAALAGCVGGLFGDRVEETRSYDFDLPAKTPVRVMGVNGDVAVEPTARADIGVDARVAVPSEDRFDDVSVRTAMVEDALAIDVDVQGSTSNVSVDLDVEVPEGTAMAVVQTQNGDVEVAGVDGVEAARSSNGDVTVRDAGPVQSVSTENGDIDADVPAPLRGEVLLRTENGDVEAALSPAVDAVLDAQTQNGTVSVTGLELGDANRSGTQVTGTLGEGGPTVTVAAVNGDVTVQALDE